MQLSDKTVVNMSLSALGSGVVAIGLAVSAYYETKGTLTKDIQSALTTGQQALQVAHDAKEEVASLTLTVRMENLKRDIKELEKELRALQRELAENPGSRLISDQIDQVERELQAQLRVLQCYRNSVVPERCGE